MKTFEITLSKREEVGKKNTKKLRRENHVPCVVYGGEENLHVHAHKNEFRKIIYTPNVFLLKLTVEGATYNAIMKDLQFHPVTDELLHIDFLQIFDEKKVNIEIPVTLTGSSVGILAGGFLLQPKSHIRIFAFPKDIPDSIEVDITELSIGSSIQIRDLEIENVEFMDNETVMVVAINQTRTSVVEETEEEEEEEGTEEGAEKTDVSEKEEKK